MAKSLRVNKHELMLELWDNVDSLFECASDWTKQELYLILMKQASKASLTELEVLILITYVIQNYWKKKVTPFNGGMGSSVSSFEFKNKKIDGINKELHFKLSDKFKNT